MTENSCSAVHAAAKPAPEQLMEASANWISAAMLAWADDDFEKVAVLAPLAVELLGKAVLWTQNPVLLVPLAPTAEPSLLNLAMNPDLSNPRLRTVGLSILLDRLELVLGTLPVDKKRRSRLVAIRNGAIHVGSPDQSRYALTDSLSLCSHFLEKLGTEPKAFFADQYRNVVGLLDANRSEVAQRVTIKRARARNHLAALEQRLSPEVFQESTDRLEELTRDTITPEDFGLHFGASDLACPECGSMALLMGTIDVDSEPDYDVEPLGGGHYYTYMAGTHTTITITPDTFVCNVCNLTLQGRDELSECNIDSNRHEVDSDSLGDDFTERFLGVDWN